MGRSIDSAFPSKYLKSSDIPETGAVVTIDRVDIEQIGQGAQKELKPVIYFVGKTKGMVCNKTNANSIAKFAGSRDLDDWSGVKIKLVVAEVEFQGQPVEAIRVREAKAGAVQNKPKPAPAEDDFVTAPEEDEIGF